MLSKKGTTRFDKFKPVIRETQEDTTIFPHFGPISPNFSKFCKFYTFPNFSQNDGLPMNMMICTWELSKISNIIKNQILDKIDQNLDFQDFAGFACTFLLKFLWKISETMVFLASFGQNLMLSKKGTTRFDKFKSVIREARENITIFPHFPTLETGTAHMDSYIFKGSVSEHLRV